MSNTNTPNTEYAVDGAGCALAIAQGVVSSGVGLAAAAAFPEVTGAAIAFGLWQMTKEAAVAAAEVKFDTTSHSEVHHFNAGMAIVSAAASAVGIAMGNPWLGVVANAENIVMQCVPHPQNPHVGQDHGNTGSEAGQHHTGPHKDSDGGQQHHAPHKDSDGGQQHHAPHNGSDGGQPDTSHLVA